MGVHQVFASQVYQSVCLAPRSALFRALQKETKQIERADREGHDWSLSNYPNGYTSYGSWDQMHRMSPHFEELAARIDRHVRRFARALAWDVNPRDLRMTRFWVNVMKPNTIHTMHIHPLSVVSGTFYLDVPSGSSPLKFEDPRFNLFMGRPPVKATAPRARQSFLHFNPRPGDVILFESWMRHEVPLLTGTRERVSFSFNYDWIRS